MNAILERSRMQVHLESARGPRYGVRLLYCPCGCPIWVPERAGEALADLPFCPGCGTRLSKVVLSAVDPREDHV